jgi:hypothetical protein
MEFARQQPPANGIASLALIIVTLKHLFPETFSGSQLAAVLAEAKALIVATGVSSDEARDLIDRVAVELGNPR